MEIHEILESLEKGKISINNAKKLLSLYSIEEIEGNAKIDINRRKRRGVTKVIFAETKKLEEIKKIIEKQFGLEEDAVEEESLLEADLNITELDLEDLIAVIEQRYDISIPQEEYIKFKTVTDVATYLYEHADQA